MTTQRRRKAAEEPAGTDRLLAVQVKRPYRNVTSKFPRTHRHDKPNGRFDYFRILDQPQGANRAYEGDWLVKKLDGTVVAMTNDVYLSVYDH